MKEAVLFIAGVLSMGYAVASVCFARFWRQTGDRLFAWFAGAFALLAVQRVAVSLAPTSDAPFLLRLAAFLVIIIAIADKNRAAR
jgi:hypothetical protein